jgi:hypothetical protein
MTILVTVPHQHWIRAELAATLLRLQQDGRYGLTVEFPCDRPYENTLNAIVRRMRDGAWDYWLSIDADNPPQRNPLDLVALDKDVIGLPTPVWHYRGGVRERPIYWNAYRYDPATDAYREWTEREGLQQVDAVGSGCLLVARRVLDHPGLQQGAFLREWHADGTVRLGADLAFCRRVLLAGFTVWCHFGYPCHHFAEVDLDLAARAIKGLVEAR